MIVSATDKVFSNRGCMKNKEAMVLTERAADSERLRVVLRDWGYKENEIHRVLKEQSVDQKENGAVARSVQSTKV